MHPEHARRLRFLATRAQEAPTHSERALAASVLVIETLKLVPEPRAAGLRPVPEQTSAQEGT